MKVTLDIDDDLYTRIEEIASATGCSIPEVIDEALRRVLSDSAQAKTSIDLPRSKETSWVHPGIEINNARAVRDNLE